MKRSSINLILLVVIFLTTACSFGLKTATPPPTVPTHPPVLASPPAATATHAATPTAPVSVKEKPAGVAGGQSIGDPYAPELGNTGYDVQHYTLRFTLDPEIAYVHARVTIDALSTLANLGQISLDFIGFDITALTVDGQPADYSRENDKLIINLPSPRDEGQAFSVEVTYQGEPDKSRSKYVYFLDQMGLTFQSDFKVVFAMSEPDGARRWYPCNDHPRDKATYTTELTVPELMQGVSNGTLVDVKTEIPNAMPDGRAGDRYTWEMKQPMATYLATVVVGDYKLLEGKSKGGIKLRTYIFPKEEQNFSAGYAQVGDAIDWMAKHFGPYPFDAFGYVMVGGTNFSMETQTMVMESSTMGPETLIHEMSHQWFGDWVSLDSWADIWRNEGFATYITALYYVQKNPGVIDQMVQAWTKDLQDHPTDFPLNNPPAGEMFGRAEYEQGALLAHDLNQTMGDDPFFKGLQNYFKKYGGKSASFDEFKAEMEAAAGKPLDNVFAKWFAVEPVKQ